MKIAYLHGLESNNIGPKNDWLRTIADIYDPLIDYKKPGIYQDIKEDVIALQPDLLIGSSMGGYFSFTLAKELNIPAVLFNPALHSRSMQPDMQGNESAAYKPKMCFVFGEKDEIIDPYKTIELIAKDGYESNDYMILPHGHKTDFALFKKAIEDFIHNKFLFVSDNR